MQVPYERGIGPDPSLPPCVEIGDHTYYIKNRICFMNFLPTERIIIGKYCSIAPEVTFFVGGNHSMDTVSTYPFDNLLLGRENPTRSYRTTRNTEIGSDVWIGYQAHIGAGVHIGHGAVVASRAVVFTDVPPYAIAVGNPAQIMRYRFSKETVDRLLRIGWWNWPDEDVRSRVEWFYRPTTEFLDQFDSTGSAMP